MNAPTGGPYGRCTDGCVTCATSSTPVDIPVVAAPKLPAIDLADYRSGTYTEWHYGAVRGPWQSYPIVAQPAGDGLPFCLTVSGHMEMGRDQVPHLIAWLSAVYAATEPGPVECDCGAGFDDIPHESFCAVQESAR